MGSTVVVTCDGCGSDVGNGDISSAAFINRFNPRNGLIEQLHLCYKVKELKSGEQKVSGCAEKVLGPGKLSHYDREHRGETDLTQAVNREDEPGLRSGLRGPEADSGDSDAAPGAGDAEAPADFRGQTASRGRRGKRSR